MIIQVCEITEKAMVGCIVTSAGTVLDSYDISEDHFFTHSAQAVYRAARSLHTERLPIDFFAVRGRMEANAIPEADMIDWLSYPTLATVPTHYATLCEKLTLRKANALSTWIAGNLGTHDVPALCADINTRAASLHVSTATDNLVPSAIVQVHERCARMRRGDKPRRMLTPIEAWNRLFSGLADGNYYGIASRPGLGKTAMMEQMLSGYMTADMPVLCFEKDMSPQKLIERIACREAKVPYWKYDRELLEPHEVDRVEKWAKAIGTSPLRIYSPIGLTAESMCAIIRREVRVNKVRAVFLDHIQCLRFPGRDIREGLTAASLTIRQCVTETGVPHVILAHLNRDAAKNGRPQPEQIKEFDQFFGDVDALALLWSEVDQADVKQGQMRPMKLYAAKNRGGACIEEDLRFDGPLLTFQ